MIGTEYIKILIKYYPKDIEKKVDHPKEKFFIRNYISGKSIKCDKIITY
jgi:hypothetical protein